MSEGRCEVCEFWEKDTTLPPCGFCFSDDTMSQFYNGTHHPLTQNDFGCIHWKEKKPDVKFRPSTFFAVAKALHMFVFQLTWKRAIVLGKTIGYGELPEDEKETLLADAKELLEIIAGAEK